VWETIAITVVTKSAAVYLLTACVANRYLAMADFTAGTFLSRWLAMNVCFDFDIRPLDGTSQYFRYSYTVGKFKYTYIGLSSVRLASQGMIHTDS
jgi:hypothetical protein